MTKYTRLLVKFLLTPIVVLLFILGLVFYSVVIVVGLLTFYWRVVKFIFKVLKSAVKINE